MEIQKKIKEFKEVNLKAKKKDDQIEDLNKQILRLQDEKLDILG